MGNSDVPDEHEQRSEAIFSALMGGTSTFTDVRGAPPMTPDFSIELPGGRQIALEVTTSTDGKVRAQINAIGKRNWESLSLSSSWSISFSHVGVDLRALSANVEPLLSTLEMEAVPAFDRNTNLGLLNPAAEKAIRELRLLGVQAAASVSTPPGVPTYILVGEVGPGGWAGADDVNDVVEAEAAGNVEKLRRAGADEGHLFIWIDSSNPAPEVAMFAGTLPSQPPTLPVGVDVVWIATRPRPAQLDAEWAGSLWRVSATSGWEVLTPPPR